MMRRRAQAGMTLIELMVAILISMVLSIAVMKVMSTFEGKRRTLGSSSDLDSGGNLAMFQIDRWVRSAGTGFVQGNAYTYGCRLFATNTSAGQLLPLTSTLPAPFASTAENSGATTTYRLAPVIIVSGGTTPGVSGQASDVLVVMATGNGGSQIPAPLTGPPTATSLPLANVTDFPANDLLLVADQQPNTTTGGPKDCMVSQADSGTPANGVATSLALSGPYYAATISSIPVSLANSFTFSSVAIDLGGTSATGSSAPPQFQVIGVGDNNTLYSYDLLGVASPALQAQAEGVFEIHAVYGIDSTASTNNVIDQWVDATSSSAYYADKLTAGTAAAAQLLKNIRAVHVAIIMRTALPERDPTNTPATLTYFNNVPGMTAKTRAMSTAEQAYRYRVIETTIPVRNNQY